MNINVNNLILNQNKIVKTSGNLVTKKNGIQKESTPMVSNKKSTIVDISDTGKMKASHHSVKLPSEPEEGSAADQYVKKLEGIINSVKNGEKLSSKDQKWLNEELQTMASGQYSAMKSFRLSDDCEAVLMALKEHYFQRQRIFEDMQKQVEAQRMSSESYDEVKFFAEQFETEKEKDTVEMLKETLGQEEQESEACDEEANEEDSNEISEADALDLEQEKAFDDEKKAVNIITANQEQLEEIGKQKSKELTTQRKLDSLLDELYDRTKKDIASQELTNEEKVKAYENFVDASKVLAFDREIERHKVKFDYETQMLSKIMFQSHNDLSEVLKKYNAYKPNIIGKDIVLNLLR